MHTYKMKEEYTYARLYVFLEKIRTIPSRRSVPSRAFFRQHRDFHSRWRAMLVRICNTNGYFSFPLQIIRAFRQEEGTW